MSKTYPRLAEAQEIRSLISRARAILDVVAEGEDAFSDPSERNETDVAYRGAKEALRFAAFSAGLARDILLVPEVIQAVEEQAHWDEYGPSDIEVAAEALSRLLAAGGVVDDAVAELADHHKSAVRGALAKGLDPTNERSRALLEKLSVDAVAEVRKPARATLAKVQEVPSWAGKFQRDPFAQLSADEIAKHKPTLDRISAMVDASSYEQRRTVDELAPLVASLPDALIVDFVVTQLSVASHHDERLEPLGTILCSREGGGAGLARLCEAWGKVPYYWTGDAHIKMVTNAPAERQLEVCLTLARWALSRSENEREIQNGGAHIAASIAGKAFPKGADLTPLLDGLLALPNSEASKLDWVQSGLRNAFEAEGADPGPILERVLEARLSGYQGAWRGLGGALDKLLSRAPRERLRDAALKAMESEDPDLLQWGLRQLLLHAHDPARDGTPLETAARLLSEPRYRAAILKHYELRRVASGVLRSRLRSGALDFEQAATAVVVIGVNWGGVVGQLIRARPTTMDPEEEETELAEERAPWAAFLGPEELHGPVTAAEWRLLREARSKALAQEEFPWRLAFEALPEGRFDAEDRPLVDAALERITAKNNRRLAMLVATALSAKPDVDMLPVFDRLFEHAEGKQEAIRYFLRQTQKELGLSTHEPESEDQARSGDEEQELRDWMSED